MRIHIFFFNSGCCEEKWFKKEKKKKKGRDQRTSPKKGQSAGNKPIHIPESKKVPELKERGKGGTKNRRKYI